jgi:hypothetical protein
MPFEVIYAREGHVQAQRQRLCVRQPHEQRAGESGSAGGRYRVEFARFDARLAERPPRHGYDEPLMRTRGHFGHDAAVLFVIGLRGNDARAKFALHEHSGGGVVAGTFQTEQNVGHRHNL